MEEKELELLFVGGDMSGIQKFLYNVTSKMAAVSLMGRSAYLDIRLKEICDGLKKQLDTSEEIYCSGGKFYLKTPNTAKNILAIDEYFKAIEKEMWEEHKGQLFLYITAVPYHQNPDGTINTKDKNNCPIGELWRLLAERFSILKNRKMSNILLENYNDFFEVQNVGGTPDICAITGLETEKLVTLDKDEEGHEVKVSEGVYHQIEIGRKKRQDMKHRTFASYAAGQKLAVLRMDVDGLGARFQKCNTFEEYKNFSNRLQEFFSQKILIIQHYYSKYIGLVYAGGDDVFAVGNWNKIIEFSHDIQEYFSKSFKDFPGLTISAGITIVDDKFPIAKAAEMAGKAEDDSKHYNNGEKNALTFFGQTISWFDYQYINDFKDKFVELCSQGMPKSILHKVMLFNYMRERGQLQYLWNSIYFLTRFKEGKNNNIAEFCNMIESEYTSDINNYAYIALAARWAEYQIR